MKSGALWLHCLGLALADFDCDLYSSESWRATRNFVFFVRYITHDFTDFPSAKFHEIWIEHVDRCGDEYFRNRILKNFCRKRSFFQKKTQKMIFFQRLATSGRHNSAMIIDRRRFVTNGSLYGISSFHFTVGINSKRFAWPVHSVQKTYPEFSAPSDATSRHAA